MTVKSIISASQVINYIVRKLFVEIKRENQFKMRLKLKFGLKDGQKSEKRETFKKSQRNFANPIKCNNLTHFGVLKAYNCKVIKIIVF